jgi:hypothetical protein
MVREYLGQARIGLVLSAPVELGDQWRQLALDYPAGATGSTIDLLVLCSPDTAGTRFQVDDVFARTLGGSAAMATATVPGGQVVFERPTPFPNPLRGQGVIGLTLAQPGPLKIELFDLNGRRVRTLCSRARIEAGTHYVEVDGLDDRGRRLGPGLFFYRVASPQGVHTGRLVVLE